MAVLAVRLGLNMMTTSGWDLRVLASWDGIGATDHNGHTLQGASTFR